MSVLLDTEDLVFGIWYLGFGVKPLVSRFVQPCYFVFGKRMGGFV